MPVYDYLCEKCDHEFEREQRMADSPVKTCPACKARKVKRLISRTSFHLKGGGWHKDGYSSPAKETPKPEPATESPCASCPNNDKSDSASA